MITKFLDNNNNNIKIVTFVIVKKKSINLLLNKFINNFVVFIFQKISAFL